MLARRGVVVLVLCLFAHDGISGLIGVAVRVIPSCKVTPLCDRFLTLRLANLNLSFLTTTTKF